MRQVTPSRAVDRRAAPEDARDGRRV